MKHKLSNIAITGEPLGRVKMELFANVTPRTAENFRQFCTGESKDIQGRPRGYKSSKFHRVVCDKDIFSHISSLLQDGLTTGAALIKRLRIL